MSHVQTIRVLDHTGIGTIVAVSITVGANALIVVDVGLFDPGAGNPTCPGVWLDGTPDTADGTAFTEDKTQQAGSTDSRAYIFSLGNVSAGTHSVKVGRSSAIVPLAIYVSEESGRATSSWQDGAGVSATGNSANPASGNKTASVTDGLWHSFFLNENLGTDATVANGSGWAMPADPNGRNTAGGSDIVSGTEYRDNPGSIGPFNGDFVAASAQWVALTMVYKAAAAGASVGPVPGIAQRNRRHSGRYL